MYKYASHAHAAESLPEARCGLDELWILTVCITH